MMTLEEALEASIRIGRWVRVYYECDECGLKHRVRVAPPTKGETYKHWLTYKFEQTLVYSHKQKKPDCSGVRKEAITYWATTAEEEEKDNGQH